MTGFRRLIGHDGPLLLCGNLFENIFQRRVTVPNDFDVIIGSAVNVRSIDVDVRQRFVQGENRIIGVVV